MTTTYTLRWRLAVMATGDPAVKNSWGAVQDATMPLMEQGAVGTVAVSIAGLTTYTLTTANNAADQARYLRQNYIGALTGDCTITIPNLDRVGYAQNSTTGGHNVILTAGAGTSVTIPPTGVSYFWWSDGATNVSFPTAAFGGLTTPGNLAVGGNGTITGSLTSTGPGAFGGTATNDNAGAGVIGEYASSTVLSAAAVTLTTGVTANVTSLALTAGDWQVWGNVFFILGADQAVFSVGVGISMTSGVGDTAPAGGGAAAMILSNGSATFDTGIVVGQRRESLAAPATAYLVAQAGFPTSTCKAYGFIGARRVR